MAAIYSNGGNRWNILGFNFTKRDALSSVYKISMFKALQFYPAPCDVVNYVEGFTISFQKSPIIPTLDSEFCE
jgi:hypothetical protein